MKLQIQATGSAGNCYLLESANSQLVVEVGVMPTGIDYSKCEGYIISHEHGDHSAFAGKLPGLNQLQTPYKSDKWKIQNFPQKHGDTTTDIFLIRNMEEGKNIVFATDIEVIGQNQLLLFKTLNINLLLIECNYNIETYLAGGVNTYGSSSHLSDSRAIMYTGFINPLQVVFIHPSDRFMNAAKTMKKLKEAKIKNYYIAQKFPSDYNKYNANKIINF